VVLVTHALGGIEGFAEDLAAGLCAAEVAAQPTALYQVPENRKEDRTHWKYVVAERPVGLKGFLKLIWSTARWLRAAKPSVIVSTMPAANALIVPLALLFCRRARVIISHHSPVSAYRRHMRVANLLVSRSPNVAKIVCVSEAVRRSLLPFRLTNAVNVQVIRNALPPAISDFLKKIRPPSVRVKASGRVAVLGRLAPEKNLPVLLGAAATIDGLHVDLIGSGNEELSLRQLSAELKISDRVTFHGNLGRFDALTVLNAADVFVQMSLWEGHSLALLEAATLGLPLIVSNVPAQVEAVQLPDGTAAAVILEPGDVNGLGETLRLWLNDKSSYARWSSNARELSQVTSFEGMIKEYTSLVRGDASPALGC
jgi:glycosyltransferase involved in cell wall biosynthesis